MDDFIRYVRDEEGLHVTVNGDSVNDMLKASLKVFNHSPSGFEIGYGGSGPAQLALALLMMFTGPKTAVRLHQDFKFEFLADPHYREEDEFTITVDIDKWISNKLKAEKL